MPRTTLAQVEQLPDLLSGEHFTFDLGVIPGGADFNNMTIKVMDAVISGFGNTSFSVTLAGFVRNFRGQQTFGNDRTLAIVYAEDTLMNTLANLRNWQQQIVGTQSGTSAGDTSVYAIPEVYLTIYDQAGNPIDVLTFFNVFIQDVQDIQLSGQGQGQGIQVNAGFKFDYYESLLAVSR